jgi:hypothetical protein
MPVCQYLGQYSSDSDWTVFRNNKSIPTPTPMPLQIEIGIEKIDKIDKMGSD